MTSERFNDIVSTYNALKNIRSKYESDWKETLRWISPRGTEFDTDTEPRDRVPDSYERSMYDKTVETYSDTFARGLKSYTCSSQSPFFGLTSEVPEYNSDDSVRAILQQRTSQMYEMLASTRFYKTSLPFFKSYGDFGIAVMLLDYDKAHHRFLFRTLSLGDCYMMRDRITDEIDVLFHVQWLTRKEAIDLYGEEHLSTELTTGKEDYTKSYQFIQLYCRREAFGLNKEPEMPGTEWIEIAWQKGQNSICYKGGTDDRRFVAASFSESPSGDAYAAMCPGMRLANVSKAMQRMIKDQLNASQLMTNPPIRKTAGLVADIKPGGFIDVPAGQDIAPLPLVQDVSWTNEMRADMRNLAKQAYYVDFFLMLSQYSGNVNTATLAQGLQNEQVRMMSAFLDSLLDEFFSPIVTWVYSTMRDEGLFYGPAAEKLDGNVKIKMVSTLYRLQRMQELQPTQEAINMMLPFLELYPDLVYYFDFDQLAETVKDKTDADVRVFRSSDKVKELLRASAQAKAAAAQQEQSIAQQDADTRTYTAVKNAERADREAAAQNGESNPGTGAGNAGQGRGGQDRFAGLRFMR